MRSLGAIWLLLLLSSAALADKAKAREYYKSGIQHYNLTEYAEALEAFRNAYREVEDPALLFNIGQCYRQLDDKKQAVRFFRNYLRELPETSNRDEVKQLIASIEAAMAADQVSKNKPPQEPLPQQLPETPPAPVVATPPVVVVAPAPPPPKKPVYKRWWLWTTVAIVVVGGAAVGLGIGLTSTPSTQKVDVSNGTFRPFGLQQ